MRASFNLGSYIPNVKVLRIFFMKDLRALARAHRETFDFLENQAVLVIPYSFTALGIAHYFVGIGTCAYRPSCF